MVNNVEQDYHAIRIEKTPLTGFGEVLVDRFVDLQGNILEDRFGGASGNTATDLALLGATVSMVGVLGNNPDGRMLVKTLEEKGVNTDSLICSDKFKTPVAIVRVEANGERNFDRFEPGLQVIPRDIKLPPTQILFFGSLSQIDSESKEATQSVLNQAQDQGARTYYDPNFRDVLWTDRDIARKTILETMRKVSTTKINEQELLLLTGQNHPKVGAEMLFQETMDALFITLGEYGVYYKTQRREDYRSGYVVKNVVDTTGAGDAFNAGMIYALAESGLSFSDMGEPQLQFYLDRAQKMAALTTKKQGATEGFPHLSELDTYKWERNSGYPIKAQ